MGAHIRHEVEEATSGMELYGVCSDEGGVDICSKGGGSGCEGAGILRTRGGSDVMLQGGDDVRGLFLVYRGHTGEAKREINPAGTP